MQTTREKPASLPEKGGESIWKPLRQVHRTAFSQSYGHLASVITDLLLCKEDSAGGPLRSLPILRSYNRSFQILALGRLMTILNRWWIRWVRNWEKARKQFSRKLIVSMFAISRLGRLLNEESHFWGGHWGQVGPLDTSAHTRWVPFGWFAWPCYRAPWLYERQLAKHPSSPWLLHRTRSSKGEPVRIQILRSSPGLLNQALWVRGPEVCFE